MRLIGSDVRYAAGTPSDDLLTRTIYSGPRYVVFPNLWPATGHFLELPNHVGLVVARESLTDDQGNFSLDHMQWYADWFTSDWMLPYVHWFIGNEMTSVSPSSWTMTPAEHSQLWVASRILHGERWIGGVADGDPSAAAPYLQPDAAGLSVHIYTLNPTDAAARVVQYQQLGVPIWVGETHPVDGYTLADYQWPAGVNVNDFDFSEAMVPGMGLYS